MANVSTKDVKNYLDNKYVAADKEKYYQPLYALSGNTKITSNLYAYNFDEIKNSIFSDARSCDALYLKKHLNFIEFKTGFSSPLGTTDKVKKENLMLSIALKASHSLQLFESSILSMIEDKELAPTVQKIFCAVIDSNQQEIAEEVGVDVLLDVSKITSDASWKKGIIDNILKIIRSETTQHKKFMYDYAFSLYDFEFDKNIDKLR